MNTITPIPGQHYRTRDGSRYRCYAVDGEHPKFPVHGATLHGRLWATREHTADGRYFEGGEEHIYDLVAEWTEPEPMVPWSQCPKWVQWQTMDKNGDVFGWEVEPDLSRHQWVDECEGTGNINFPHRLITHKPADWRKSLIQRPAQP